MISTDTPTGLLLSTMLIFFSGGVLVGRFLVHRQIASIRINDLDRILLCIFFSMGFSIVQQATKMGWLPSTLLPNWLFVIVNGVILTAMVFLVWRCLRECGTSAA
jgi:hypothetical protein